MYNLVYSDGTGQRGVRRDGASTNIYKMHLASRNQNGQMSFYDPGIGSDPGDHELDFWQKLKNLYDKATGFGIEENIADCYDFLIRAQDPARPNIGLFGFSRGAYTVRSAGSVLALCGIPAPVRDGIDLRLDDEVSKRRRREIAEEAVAIYKTGQGHEGEAARQLAGDAFKEKYKSTEALPKVIGVFDTVKALGLPGLTDVLSGWQHTFHNNQLNKDVAFGLQALSVDENRKVFAPILWDESDPGPNQSIEQRWFPGVHSDIGGGYVDDRLSDFAMDWMVAQCRQPALDIRFAFADCDVHGDVLGDQHDERTGFFGVFWRKGLRTEFIRKLAVDIDLLANPIEDRFEHKQPPYRPDALSGHPRVNTFY